MKTSNTYRSLLRVLCAALLALGTWLAVPPTPAYATPPCDDTTGVDCGSQKACIAIWGTDIYVCITRYYYWQADMDDF